MINNRITYQHFKALKYYAKFNEGKCTFHALFNSQNWNDEIEFQIILMIEINMHKNPNAVQYNLMQLQKLIEKSKSPLVLSSTIYILNEYWNMLDDGFQVMLEKYCEEYAYFLIYQSVSDSFFLNTFMNSNSEMLKRILNKFPKKLFYRHKIECCIDGQTGSMYVPSILDFASMNLRHFIEKEVGIKIKPIQTVSIEDIMDWDNKDNKRTSSYKGYIANIDGNEMECFVPQCFGYALEKIPICNKKKHKTPDWIIGDEYGVIYGTVECYSSKNTCIKKGVNTAISHANLKEIGKKYYSKEFNLPNKYIKIATFVCYAPVSFPFDTIDFKQEIKRTTFSNTNIDLLLYIWVNRSTSEIKAFYYNLSGITIPDNMFVTSVENIDSITSTMS